MKNKSNKNAKLLEEFIDHNEEGSLDITNSVSYKVRDIIENNQRLYHSVFENAYEPDKTKKIFYNICWVIYDIFYRNTDIDTKDLAMHSTNGEHIKLLDLIKMGVKSMLRRINFNSTLNDIRRNLLKDGVVLAKVVDGQIKLCNLLNIVIPPHAEDVQQTGLVEKISMNYAQIRGLKKEFGANWHLVEAVKAKMQGGDEFVIYEWWTWITEKGKMHKGCKRFFDTSALDKKDYQNPDLWGNFYFIDQYITPFKRRVMLKSQIEKMGEWEELFPYQDGWAIKIDGRWLGLGLFERLAEIQADYNEKGNLKRKEDRLGLRGIYFHKKGANSNSLSQDMLDRIETGAILEGDADEDLIKVNTGGKSSEAIMAMDKLYEFAKLLTGTTSQGAGEALPANTPATIGVINQQVAKTAFDTIIEAQSIFLTELFSKFYLPELLKNMTKEGWINIAADESELKEFDTLLVKTYMHGNETTPGMLEQLKNEGYVITPEEAAGYEEKMMGDLAAMGSERFPEMTDEMIDKVSWFLEFYVNNESFDKLVTIKNLFQMAQDPQFPGSRKKLYWTILDLLDMGGKRFEKSEEELALEAQQALAMQMQGAKGNGNQQTMSQEPVPENVNQFNEAVMKQ